MYQSLSLGTRKSARNKRVNFIEEIMSAFRRDNEIVRNIGMSVLRGCL